MIIDVTVRNLRSLTATGSSELMGVLDGCSSDILIDLQDACAMKLAGSADDFELRMQGASEFHGEEFSAGNVKIRTEDATEASIFVTGKLSGTAGGTSEVQYGGNPSQVQVSVSEIGEITPVQ